MNKADKNKLTGSFVSSFPSSTLSDLILQQTDWIKQLEIPPVVFHDGNYQNR